MELGLKIATVLEYSTMLLLFVLSIWSVSIMIDRRRVLGGVSAPLDSARALIRAGDMAGLTRWTQEHPGVAAEVLKTVLQNVSAGSEAIDRAARATLTEEKLKLEKGLSVLATLGANAPFIGLFGTVLGIIRSFAALADSSGAAASVMSGISQALVATAAGLFVAIPAVVAFNYFSQRLKVVATEGDSLKDLFVAQFGRKLSS